MHPTYLAYDGDNIISLGKPKNGKKNILLQCIKSIDALIDKPRIVFTYNSNIIGYIMINIC